MKKNIFTKDDLDVLKEWGNICAGNATIALAQLLFKKITLETSTVTTLAASEIGKYVDQEDRSVICIQMDTLGAVQGRVLLLFGEKSAHNLIELLVGKTTSQGKFITQIGISSMKEIGNIVMSSYLSTLSSLSRIPIFPSCPQFMDGQPSAVLNNMFSSFGRKKLTVLLIETVFGEESTSVKGKFFIAFDSTTMQSFLAACRSAGGPA
ncbi:MAG: chemotaxis protein CheC [Candidatus Omnitrophica bacterium]|nr:chemotaxis protein CheC [Candidatus Omnitrophota bacterium]